MPKDEDELWSQATEGVRPVKGKERVLTSHTESREKQPPESDHVSSSNVKHDHPTSFHDSRAGNIVSLGDTSRVDRKLADTVRKGKYPIDIRLDLHGKTREQAENLVIATLERAYMQGRRCVLIITGKGGVLQGGVLQNEVPRWLSESRIAPLVLFYDYAQPKDGGKGALYVLLRRNDR